MICTVVWHYLYKNAIGFPTFCIPSNPQLHILHFSKFSKSIFQILLRDGVAQPSDVQPLHGSASRKVLPLNKHHTFVMSNIDYQAKLWESCCFCSRFSHYSTIYKGSQSWNFKVQHKYYCTHQRESLFSFCQLLLIIITTTLHATLAFNCTFGYSWRLGKTLLIFPTSYM